MKFVIEQIAIVPPNAARAIALLSEMGLSEWARDHVCAAGAVHGEPGANEADLAFNYDATSPKPLEFEVLDYTSGPNWMEQYEPSASHLGMHCSEEDLAAWHTFFTSRGIHVAQEVRTHSHTNPVIAGKRFYTYVIYNTRPILGIDTKFIVRRDVPQQG